MTLYRIKKLNSLKTWSWNLLDSRWFDNFAKVKEFEDENDHLFMYGIKTSTNKWFRKEFYKYRDNDPDFEEKKRNLFDSLKTLWMIKEEITQKWFFRYKKVLDYALNGGNLVLLHDTDLYSYK